MDALSEPAKMFDTSGKSAALLHHHAICKLPMALPDNGRFGAIAGQKSFRQLKLHRLACRFGPRPLICRRSPLPIQTRPARSRSLTPTASAAFWKERASRRSRSLPVTSRLEAVTSIRCCQFVRGSELWARVFGRIQSSGPRRYRQFDLRLRHTMDLMGSG